MCGSRHGCSVGVAGFQPKPEPAFAEALRAQDKKDQPKKGDDFSATIVKVSGNKVTINRSTKDKKVDDITLTAVDKVKIVSITPKVDPDNLTLAVERVEVKDGLKSDIFKNRLRARIMTDAKNNITEITVINIPQFGE